MKRKYLIEFDEDNPFLKEDMILDEKFWDWYFEQHSYDVKFQTLKDYSNLLDIQVKNRDIINHSFLVLIIDVPNMGMEIDQLLVYFLHSLFLRMIKTSKVVQDLSIHGNYIEAKSILRNNFERAVLVEYFLKNIDKLRPYLKAKKEQNKKLLLNYTIKNLSNIVRKSYEDYIYLCQFAHPARYSEDTQFVEMEGNSFVKMQAYNEYIYQEFMWINYMNNNLLLESFSFIVEYLKKFIPKKEAKDKSIKAIFKEIKKLGFVLLNEKEDKSKYSKSIFQ